MSQAQRNWYAKPENKQKVLDSNKRRKERILRLIRRYKSFCGCRVCGEREAVCLDLHHEGEKEFTISSANGVSLARLRAEIRKCIVLCANCHRKVHAGLV